MLRDEGEAYAAKLRLAGVPVTTVRYDGTCHDFMLLNALSQTKATRAAIGQATAFLRDAFRNRLSPVQRAARTAARSADRGKRSPGHALLQPDPDARCHIGFARPSWQSDPPTPEVARSSRRSALLPRRDRHPVGCPDALHLLRTGYNPVRDAVSDYGVGRYRAWFWAQAVAGGIAGLALAIALAETTPSVPTLVVAMLVISAVARFLIPAFATDQHGSRFQTVHGTIHMILAIVIFALG